MVSGLVVAEELPVQHRGPQARHPQQEHPRHQVRLRRHALS